MKDTDWPLLVDRGLRRVAAAEPFAVQPVDRMPGFACRALDL
jgi:hypothetical protein